MVGTAVYQVGRASSSQRKKLSALKPGVHTTSPPAASEERTAAISPWMWKSGMMLRQRSSGRSAKVAPMCLAEAAMLACDSGTNFGRDVVPEVWRRRATSSGVAKPEAAEPKEGPSSANAPAGPAGSV